MVLRESPSFAYNVQIIFFKRTNNPVSGQTQEVHILVHPGGCRRGKEKPAQTEAGCGSGVTRLEIWSTASFPHIILAEFCSCFRDQIVLDIFNIPLAPFCRSEELLGLSPRVSPQVLVISLVLEFVRDLVTKLHQFHCISGWLLPPLFFPLLF